MCYSSWSNDQIVEELSLRNRRATFFRESNILALSSYPIYTVVELKKILSRRGLKVSGKKGELVKRLEDDDEGKVVPQFSGSSLVFSNPGPPSSAACLNFLGQLTSTPASATLPILKTNKGNQISSLSGGMKALTIKNFVSDDIFLQEVEKVIKSSVPFNEVVDILSEKASQYFYTKNIEHTSKILIMLYTIMMKLPQGTNVNDVLRFINVDTRLAFDTSKIVDFVLGQREKTHGGLDSHLWEQEFSSFDQILMVSAKSKKCLGWEHTSMLLKLYKVIIFSTDIGLGPDVYKLQNFEQYNSGIVAFAMWGFRLVEDIELFRY
jgi:hypothetical protein